MSEAARGSDEIDECARLSGATGYGEAAGAVMSSDGTFNGPMGEKCDPQQLEPGIRQGKGEGEGAGARQLRSLGGGREGSWRCSCPGGCAVPPTTMSPIAGGVERWRGA